MKLVFLGSGSAFTDHLENYHSNMLLIADDGSKLLIDCGSDARHSIRDAGYNYRDITDVYISHLHSDHVGGLEWLGFTHKFDPSLTKPNLYLSQHLVESIWEKVLSGGMSSLQGEIAELSTYFNVHPIEDNSYFVWKDIRFYLVQTVHIASGYCIMPSYGLMFKVNSQRIFITTDTQFAPHQINSFYAQADLIFHDCETAKVMSGVHAHYDELKSLAPDVKKKIWLYHYNPGDKPDAQKDGFLGFVKRGDSFDVG